MHIVSAVGPGTLRVKGVQHFYHARDGVDIASKNISIKLWVCGSNKEIIIIYNHTHKMQDQLTNITIERAYQIIPESANFSMHLDVKIQQLLNNVISVRVVILHTPRTFFIYHI